MPGLALTLMLLAGSCPELLPPPAPAHGQVAQTAAPHASVAARAMGVLHRWDRRRARAFAIGDTAALRALYVDGAAAGRRDVAVLRAYVDRGLRIDGLTTQVLSARVCSASSGRLRIRVVDRVVAGSITGSWRAWPLPREQARVHLIDLRRSGTMWRVASVGLG